MVIKPILRVLCRFMNHCPKKDELMTDLFSNPFSKISAHHRPIGDAAKYGSATDPLTVALRLNGSANLNAGQGFAGGFVTVIKNASTNAIKTVKWDGTAGGAGLPVTLKLPALPNSTSGDRTVIVFDIAGSGNVYEFYHFNWNSGSPKAGNVHIFSPKAVGHPTTANPARVGVSASGSSVLMGLVRGAELVNGVPIQHLIHCSMANQTTSTHQMLSKTHVWPCFYIDGYCTKGSGCGGKIAYGQLYAIQPGTPVPSGLTELGRRIFNQLRDYGLRPIDGAGNNVHNRGDQVVTATQRNDWNASLSKLWPLLRPVLNDAESQNASGGGNPIAVNTAWDA